MIIWGSGGGSSELGVVSTENCKTCEKERPFKLFVTYRYAHLYFCRWVTRRQYIKACEVCHKGWTLDTKQVQARLSRDPIPFATRYGALCLAGFVLLVIGCLSLAHR